MNGIHETNPIPPNYNLDMDSICFDQLTQKDKIILERLRLVTDPFLPFYEVSYCHALVNGVRMEVVGFPGPIPKKGWASYLINVCKEHKIYFKDIANSAKISKLSF